jgi:hypothetical protein
MHSERISNRRFLESQNLKSGSPGSEGSLSPHPFLLPLVVCFWATNLFGLEFEVSGRFSGQAFNPYSGEITGKFDGIFEYAVSNSLWWARTRRFDEPFDYLEAGSDSTNCYLLGMFEKEQQRRSALGERTGENVAFTQVHPGTIPRYMGFPYLSVLWFGFSSRDYLETITGDLYDPIVLASSDPLQMAFTSYKVKGRVERFGDGYGLPKSAVFYSDGKRPVFQPGNMISPPDAVRWKKPYDKGFKVAEYDCQSVTNIQGVILPVRFAYRLFMPKHEGADASEVVQIHLYQVEATNFARGTGRISFLPLLPAGKTTVQDYRFLASEPKVPPFTYHVTSQWLSEAEIKATKNFQTALQREAERTVRPPQVSGRAPFLAALLVLFAPVLALFYRGWRQKLWKTGQTET